MAGKERRSRARKPVRWTATWRVYEETGPAVVDEGEVCDISAEGLFLHPFSFTAHPLWPGTRVRVEVSPESSSAELKLHGVVKWLGLHKGHGEGGVGIELDAESQRELEGELKKR
jgi:hypothetical protein